MGAVPGTHVHTADNAVPPLDVDHEAVLDSISHTHPGLTLIADGLRLLSRDRLTVDQTRTILAFLSGHPYDEVDGEGDVLSAHAFTIQRLTDPATNPCLRALPAEQQKNTQHYGEQAAYALTDPELHQPTAEACAAIDGT